MTPDPRYPPVVSPNIHIFAPPQWSLNKNSETNPHRVAEMFLPEIPRPGQKKLALGSVFFLHLGVKIVIHYLIQIYSDYHQEMGCSGMEYTTKNMIFGGFHGHEATPQWLL